VNTNRLATLVVGVALLALTTTAVASQSPGGGPYNGASNPGSSHVPTGATGATGTTGATGPGNSHRPSNLPTNAKAYGFYCQKESKKHVAGQKGTPFSQCVTAMAKLAHGDTNNPAKACAKESKKHVAGQKGTPFSQCVSAAAKLLGSQNGQSDGTTGPTGPTGTTGATG
jgi:hypothetical protein